MYAVWVSQTAIKIELLKLLYIKTIKPKHLLQRIHDIWLKRSMLLC
jgi:hypothetical protein